MEFLESVRSNFLAIFQVFVLGCFGFYVLRRGILGECCLRTISNLVIDITLPCFIFTNILNNFDAVRGEAWHLFPIYSAGMLALAAGLALAWMHVDPSVKKHREFAPIVTFQNAGFLPIIIVNALTPEQVAGRLYVYIFLFVLIFPPLLYTVSGRIFSSGGAGSEWKNLFNAASVTTAVALGLALAGARPWMPEVVFHPLEMLGDTTIPLSMIVIGGIVMVNFSRHTRFPYGFVLKAAFLSLVALPLIVYGLVGLLPVSSEVRFLLLLEAMMPPAATLPLIARKYNADYELTGQALFGVTMLSLITAPLLLAIMNAVPS